MKKLLMAAVAITAITATPAMADTTSVYTITGNVGAMCAAASAKTIALNNLVGTDGALLGTGGSISDLTAYCNGAGTTVRVQHTDLTTGHPFATGFTNDLTYSYSVVAGSGASAVTFTADAAAGTALGSFSGLTVNVLSVSGGGNKPVAGDYSGAITITLYPAV